MESMNSNPIVDAPLQRISLALLYLSSTGYMLYQLYSAAYQQSLSQGFESILSNTWATSALVDYLAGLVLSIPFLWTRSHSVFESVFMCVILFLLGNPILLLRISLDLFTTNGGLKESFIKPKVSSVSLKLQRIGLFILQFLGILMFCFYTAICIRAISTEPIADGWTFIKNDPWSFVTFLDNLLGIFFTIVYVGIREIGSIWKMMLWIICILILGNGVTCVYVLVSTLGKFSVMDSIATSASVNERSDLFDRID